MIAPFSISVPVTLIGFMGAGKTTIGQALAERMQTAFVDLDTELEARLRMPISRLFATRGESEFRDGEARLLHEALSDPHPRVIATGGGVVTRPENRALLRSRSVCCFLDPAFPVLWQRLQSVKASRPLLSGQSEDDIKSLWERRREWYRQTAHITISEDLDPENLTEVILLRLGEEHR